MCTRCQTRSLSGKKAARLIIVRMFSTARSSHPWRDVFLSRSYSRFCPIGKTTQDSCIRSNRTQHDRWKQKTQRLFFCFVRPDGWGEKKRQRTPKRPIWSATYRTKMKTTTDTVTHETSFLSVKWLTGERYITQLCVATGNPARVHMFIVNNLPD